MEWEIMKFKNFKLAHDSAPRWLQLILHRVKWLTDKLFQDVLTWWLQTTNVPHQLHVSASDHWLTLWYERALLPTHFSIAALEDSGHNQGGLTLTFWAV